MIGRRFLGKYCVGLGSVVAHLVCAVVSIGFGWQSLFAARADGVTPISVLRTGALEWSVPISGFKHLAEQDDNVQWFSRVDYVDHFTMRHAEVLTFRVKGHGLLGRVQAENGDNVRMVYRWGGEVGAFVHVLSQVQLGMAWHWQKFTDLGPLEPMRSGPSVIARWSW